MTTVNWWGIASIYPQKSNTAPVKTVQSSSAKLLFSCHLGWFIIQYFCVQALMNRPQQCKKSRGESFDMQSSGAPGKLREKKSAARLRESTLSPAGLRFLPLPAQNSTELFTTHELKPIRHKNAIEKIAKTWKWQWSSGLMTHRVHMFMSWWQTRDSFWRQKFSVPVFWKNLG